MSLEVEQGRFILHTPLHLLVFFFFILASSDFFCFFFSCLKYWLMHVVVCDSILQ